jgi:hypothetical protein
MNCVWLLILHFFSFLVLYRNDKVSVGCAHILWREWMGFPWKVQIRMFLLDSLMRKGVLILQPLWKPITLVWKCGILNLYKWWAFYPEIDRFWYEMLRLWGEYRFYCLLLVFWQILGYWTIYYSLSGTVFWCRHQSQSEGWWSCCPNLCNQTSHFKGISLILPEV